MRPAIRYLAVALMICLAPRAARAEIAMEDSIEWLCARADRVITGRIASVRAVDPRLGPGARPGPDGARQEPAAGKNRGLVLFTVHATATLKGKAQPSYCVGQRDQPSAPLEQAAARGSELIFFLSETVQATSHQGMVCNLWPLRDPNAGPYVVPLASPGRRLLSAATFQVLKDRAAIVSACQKALARLPAQERATAAPDEARGLLEVPFDTPVHQALYRGSTCYLYVPRSLFPAARSSLR